jgi:hypothetical protein
MQAAGSDAATDSARLQAERTELTERDHAVLGRSELRDQPIAPGGGGPGRLRDS